MNYFQAIILGIIQGVTEFLPISSDGHLAIAQNIFGLTEQTLSFNIFLHFATLIAVVLFFAKDILKLKFKDWLIVGVGTIPAVFFGLFIKDQIESLANSLLVVGACLILTGIFNFISHHQIKDQSESQPVTPLKAFIIGIFQAAAILPGLSRSGSTIMSASVLKMDKEAAFKFSFILAVPAILGATILQTLDVLEVGLGNINLGAYLIGGLAALITGIFSLKLLAFLIKKANFAIFGWYACLVGASLIAFSFLR